MNFDDLDSKMRIFETAHDYCVLPNIYMVARLDGRGFTKLTKEKANFERPFDIRFKDVMVQTTLHLMQCGFLIRYAYTESDEISLLFDLNDNGYARKTRKINSVLAGEASAKFSLLLGLHGVFDCRISQLPRKEDVIDYFRWRNEDAHRNALSSYCYWQLRKEGQNPQQATKAIEGLSNASKNELLFERGLNFNNFPAWQKRGVGCYWENYEKESVNPVTNETVIANRKRIKVNEELPLGQAYHEFVNSFL